MQDFVPFSALEKKLDSTLEVNHVSDPETIGAQTETFETQTEELISAKLAGISGKKTCRLVTLGCKVNQYETQLVKEALQANGFREAEENETAELCVVNTCTVTSEGDSKSRQVIRQMAKQNPGTKTLVMGCYATRAPEEVSRLPAVYQVVTDKRELPDIFQREGLVHFPHGISQFDGRKRAYVKIQDGCLLRCTYCIIPFVRPQLSSRPHAEIIDEVKRLIDHGHKEIILTGIHIGHYGVETTRGKSGNERFRLAHLLRRLDEIPGNWRLRLTSMEAGEIDDEFIDAVSQCAHLCPQFHPALQSGSETVLRRMRRRYSVARFLERLEQLREKIDRPAFSTDIIVGFPGETDQEFEETMQFCRDAKFMKIHVFPFSRRKGTPAASFPNQVTNAVRKERCDALGKLGEELSVDFYRQFLGEELEVLVENPIPDHQGIVFGTDRRYIPVVTSGDVSDVNTVIRVRGESISDQFLNSHYLRAAR